MEQAIEVTNVSKMEGNMDLRWPLQISARKTLLAVGDFVLVNGAALIALWVWTLQDAERSFSREFVLSQAHWFAILMGLWLLWASLNNLYSLEVAGDLRSAATSLVRTTGLVLLVYLMIHFLAPRQLLPLTVVLYHTVGTFILFGLWRGAYTVFFSRPAFRRRAVVIGAGQAGKAIVLAIRENLPSEYELVGFMDDDPAKQGQIIEGLPVMGTRRDLVTLVRAKGVSEIILAATAEMHEEFMRALMGSQEQGLQITPMAFLYEEITGRVPVEHVGDNWFLVLPRNSGAIGHLYPCLKRSMDILVASVGLVIVAFLFPVLALALYLDSPGPISYVQERVGKGGRVFNLVKFRSMVPDAEVNGRAVWAIENDPRVTRVGRFLRRTMLDELPQFINVLRGEMSIVGPRPERPLFADQLAEEIPFYQARHAAKPGMAGWALINYGYSSSVEDALVKLGYDLYYIKHQSIWLDVMILLKTLGAMVALRGRG